MVDHQSQSAGGPSGAVSTDARNQPRPPAPLPIVKAVKLLRIGAVVTALRLLLNILLAIVHGRLDVYGLSVGTVLFVGGGVGLIAGVALWIWMAEATARGKGWARSVSVVLTGLGLMLLFFDLFDVGSIGWIGLLLGIGQTAIGVAALWQMYDRESEDFYDACRELAAR